MIPAILTAVFVYYLYHSLNSGGSPSAPLETNPESTAQEQDLLQRLRLLEKRLQTLTESSSTERKPS